MYGFHTDICGTNNVKGSYDKILFLSSFYIILSFYDNNGY